MKVNANGIEINCVVEGNGPWLTMSNSLTCNLSMWDEQARLLSQDFKVLRYDTRGHGETSATAGAYTLDQLADDAKGLLNALGVEQTHWVGLSLGGMIGQICALKYPGTFQSIALCDTTSRYPPEAALIWAERISIAQEKGLEALVESTLGRWFPRALSQLAPGRDVALRADDRDYARCGLRRLLPRHPENQRHRPIEGH